MLPAAMYILRRATGHDAAAIRRVAELDEQPAPTGDVLVAQKDRVIVAALSLDQGRAVADPFVPTAEAIALLRMRAAALRAAEREPSLRRRLLAAISTGRRTAVEPRSA